MIIINVTRTLYSKETKEVAIPIGCMICFMNFVHISAVMRNKVANMLILNHSYYKKHK